MGAGLPALSCTLGPSGTFTSAGGRPRVAGTVCTRRALLPDIHCRDSRNEELIFIPATLVTAPVAELPSHRSVEFLVVLVNAKCLPSGDQMGTLRSGFAGTTTLVSFPLLMSSKVSPICRVG